MTMLNGRFADMMKCDSKVVLIASRLLIAVFGAASLLAVVRLLSIQEYAVIGIVQNSRYLISSLTSLGVVESLSREGAIEENAEGLWSLIATSILLMMLLSLISGIAMILARCIYKDPIVRDMLLISIPIIVTERLWQLSSTVLRIKLMFREYFVYNLLYGVLGSIIMVFMTLSFGLSGFFHSQWMIGLLVSIFTFSHIFRPGKFTSDSFKVSLRRLWGISWFIYLFKLSGQASRRLPIIIGGAFLSQHAIGTVSIAFDLAGKVSLLNQAISPVVGVKLAKSYASGIKAYIVEMKKEILAISLLNASAYVFFALCWEFIGFIMIGAETWRSISNMMYLALAIEAASTIIFIINLCIVIPTNSSDGLITPTIILNGILSFTIFYFRMLIESDVLLIMVSIMFPISIMAIYYVLHSIRTYSKLKDQSRLKL